MVICQTDDRVIQEQQQRRQRSNSLSRRRSYSSKQSNQSSSRGSNSNHSNSNPNNVSADYSAGSASSRVSCLVVPGFGGGAKSKRRANNRGGGTPSSNASTTDQSSTAENIFNPTANNDQQHLLLRNSNQLTSAWYDDASGMGVASSEASSQQQPMQQQPKQQLSIITPTSQQSTSPASLLSFPKAQDRGHGARRQKDQQFGVKHAYDGEMEPMGVRGQEATVAPALKESAPPIPIRNFRNGPSRSSSFQLHRQVSTEDLSTTSSQDIQAMLRAEFNDPQGKYLRTKSSILEADLTDPRGQYARSDSALPPGAEQNLMNDAFHTPTLQEAQLMYHQTLPNTPGRNNNPRNNAQAPSDEQSSEGTPTGVRTFRKSAPVNVDDSSFQDPLQNVQGIHAMAMEHVMRGEFDMALQAFSQVLTVYLEKYGRSHPLTASAYHNLGTVHSKRAGLLLDHTLHQRHCREQALLCFQAAARSARDSPQLGASHPNVAVSLVRIGFLLLQSRQYQNAVITFQEALRIRMDHYGHTHSLVANLYNNLGVCHMHLHEFVVGRRYLQQALDIQKELLAQDEFSTTALLELADTLCNIGGLCLEWIRQQGPDARHALDAESAFLEALEVRDKVLGDSHALTVQVRSLHDMVRSIPLPKVPEDRPSRSPTGILPRRSTDAASPLHSPGRPYATASTPPVSPSRRSTTRSPEALNMPFLDSQGRPRRERGKEDPPQIRRMPPSPPEDNSAAVNRSFQSEGESTNFSFASMSQAELLAYEATEESCVLNDPHHANGISVVSYAQSTANWAKNPAKRETERLAYLMQAKAILDANRDFLDSPQLTLNKQKNGLSLNGMDISRHKQYEQSEDSLVPLGGTWPTPTQDRITPVVLQEPEQHLVTIHTSANNYFKKGQYNEALQLLELVVDVQRAKHGPLHQDVGAALHNVGIAHLRLNEHYKALQRFEEAVRVRKGALGRDHPQVAVSLVKVGITLMLLERFDDSIWIFREALTVRKHSLGPSHPSTARIYNNIGCAHMEFGEPKEAKRAFEAALDIQRNALTNSPESGPVLFGAATTLKNLAFLYQKRQLYEKESMVLTECLSIQTKILGESHPVVLETLENLAQASATTEHKDQALKYYNDYLERLYDRDDDTREQQAAILFKMSKVHEEMRDLEAQLNKLHVATKLLQSESMSPQAMDLDHQIQMDLRHAHQALEKQEMKWL